MASRHCFQFRYRTLVLFPSIPWPPLVSGNPSEPERLKLLGRRHLSLKKSRLPVLAPNPTRKPAPPISAALTSSVPSRCLRRLNRALFAMRQLLLPRFVSAPP